MKTSILNKSNNFTRCLKYSFFKNSKRFYSDCLNSFKGSYLKISQLNDHINLLNSNKDQIKHYNKSYSLNRYKLFNICLNNSKNRNSLNSEVVNEMSTLLTNLSTYIADDRLKNKFNEYIVILSTEGKVFSSGHDLKEIHEKFNKYDQQLELLTKCYKTMMKIRNSRAIIVCEVQGLCTAAGLQLATSCDLIISSNLAEYCLPGTKIGLVPLTPCISLIDNNYNISKLAFDMLLTSENISAEEALKRGIINKVVEMSDKLSLDEIKTRLRQVSLQTIVDIIVNHENNLIDLKEYHDLSTIKLDFLTNLK